MDRRPETGPIASGMAQARRGQGRDAHDATVRGGRCLPGRHGRPSRRGERRVAGRGAPQPRGRRHAPEDHRVGRQARARVRVVADARGAAGPVHIPHHLRLRRSGEPHEGRRYPHLLRRRADARLGRRGRFAPAGRAVRGLHASPGRPLQGTRHGLRGVERGQRGGLLEGRRLARRLHQSAEGHASRRQGRGSSGPGRHRRPHRERLRLPREPLPGRCQGQLRLRRRTHRRRVQQDGSPRGGARCRRPDLALVVHRVPRGPRDDGRPRRRPSPDLDDRARLVGDHLQVPPGPEGAGRRDARPAGPLPHPRLCLPGERSLRRERNLVLAAGLQPRRVPGLSLRALRLRRRRPPALAAFQRAGSVAPDRPAGSPSTAPAPGSTSPGRPTTRTCRATCTTTSRRATARASAR